MNWKNTHIQNDATTNVNLLKKNTAKVSLERTKKVNEGRVGAARQTVSVCFLALGPAVPSDSV